MSTYRTASDPLDSAVLAERERAARIVEMITRSLVLSYEDFEPQFTKAETAYEFAIKLTKAATEAIRNPSDY